MSWRIQVWAIKNSGNQLVIKFSYNIASTPDTIWDFPSAYLRNGPTWHNWVKVTAKGGEGVQQSIIIPLSLISVNQNLDQISYMGEGVISGPFGVTWFMNSPLGDFFCSKHTPMIYIYIYEQLVINNLPLSFI